MSERRWAIGEVIDDLYEVVDVYEGGGMGLVHRLRHRGWRMDVVAKSPRPEIVAAPEASAAFLREAATWVGLGLHPHVVTAYYVRSIAGVPRVFAEFVDGGSLDGWITGRRLYEGGPSRALARVLDVAIQIAWGLDFAHASKLIHQDLKPANVLMTEDGVAKVADFGLSQTKAISVGELAKRRGPGMTVAVSGAGVCTREYASPEQLEGGRLTRATDVWSFGGVLLEMLAGERTWSFGPALPDVLAALVDDWPVEAPTPAPRPELVALLTRCFEVDPNARLRDAGELASELAAIYRAATGAELPRTLPERLDLRAVDLNNQGVSYVDLGEHARAFACFDKAREMDPSAFYPWFNRGVLGVRLAEVDPREILPSGADRMTFAPSDPHLAEAFDALSNVPDWVDVMKVPTAAWSSALIMMLAAAPEGSLLLDGDRVRFASTREVILGPRDEVIDCAVDPSRRFFALAVSFLGHVRSYLFDLAAGRRLREGANAQRVAVREDGVWAYAAKPSHHPVLYILQRAAEGGRVERWIDLAAMPRAIAFDGAEIVGVFPRTLDAHAPFHDEVVAWDIATGKITSRLRLEHTIPLMMPERRVLSVHPTAHRATVRTHSGEVVHTWRAASFPPLAPRGLAISPDGRRLAHVHKDRRVCLREVATGVLEAVLLAPLETSTAALADAPARVLIVAGDRVLSRRIVPAPPLSVCPQPRLSGGTRAMTRKSSHARQRSLCLRLDSDSGAFRELERLLGDAAPDDVLPETLLARDRFGLRFGLAALVRGVRRVDVARPSATLQTSLSHGDCTLDLGSVIDRPFVVMPARIIGPSIEVELASRSGRALSGEWTKDGLRLAVGSEMWRKTYPPEERPNEARDEQTLAIYDKRGAPLWTFDEGFDARWVPFHPSGRIVVAAGYKGATLFQPWSGTSAGLSIRDSSCDHAAFTEDGDLVLKAGREELVYRLDIEWLTPDEIPSSAARAITGDSTSGPWSRFDPSKLAHWEELAADLARAAAGPIDDAGVATKCRELLERARREVARLAGQTRV